MDVGVHRPQRRGGVPHPRDDLHRTDRGHLRDRPNHAGRSRARDRRRPCIPGRLRRRLPRARARPTHSRSVPAVSRTALPGRPRGLNHDRAAGDARHPALLSRNPGACDRRHVPRRIRGHPAGCARGGETGAVAGSPGESVRSVRILGTGVLARHGGAAHFLRAPRLGGGTGTPRRLLRGHCRTCYRRHSGRLRPRRRVGDIPQRNRPPGPPGDDSRRLQHGLHRAHDPQLHARSAQPGIRASPRRVKGLSETRGYMAPCLPQCAGPIDHHHRPDLRLAARRLCADRDRSSPGPASASTLRNSLFNATI